MKTSYPSFLFFMILMALPSLAILIGDRTIGETAQSGNREGLAQYDQSVPMTKKLVAPLDPDPPKEDKKIFLSRGLKETARPLLKNLTQTLLKEQGGLKHVQDLGFSPDIEKRIEDIEPADPFPIYEVGLDKLRAFAPGANVENLLADTDQLLFPIKVGQEVKSSMTLRCVRDKQTSVEQKEQETACWRITRMGLPKLIRRLTEVQHKLATQKPGLQQDFRLVSIPALNRNFLVYEENSVIRLVPLAKDHHFTAGESYLAQDVFKWLSKEAKSMDDSPR